jgi:hypothetical protein
MLLQVEFRQFHHNWNSPTGSATVEIGRTKLDAFLARPRGEVRVAKLESRVQISKIKLLTTFWAFNPTLQTIPILTYMKLATPYGSQYRVIRAFKPELDVASRFVKQVGESCFHHNAGKDRSESI